MKCRCVRMLSCFLPAARASSPCARSEDKRGLAQQLADSSFCAGSSAKKARSGGGLRRQNEPPATRQPRGLPNARARPTSSSRTLTTTICLCRAQARRRHHAGVGPRMEVIVTKAAEKILLSWRADIAFHLHVPCHQIISAHSLFKLRCVWKMDRT